jgi:hypothetical protein
MRSWFKTEHAARAPSCATLALDSVVAQNERRRTERDGLELAHRHAATDNHITIDSILDFELQIVCTALVPPIGFL